MAEFLVIFGGGNRKKWIITIIVLAGVGLGAMELLRPGTIASLASGIAGAAVQVWQWIGNVLDAFRQLISDITGWYR